ncbi:addiction module toxin, HicA family [Candidatus Kaiserbacteria bacterium CG10_big_fil_rev_8_21_14_0_10_51_14]|uniref:Addiction module toxin, HicA family n=1 Tax=Candidatus Kaiserbacteria bacterium CG10_big_fil_rev_8_21_14_0_10_51_14 TaxID=1974610 RepID=A0A2H0UBH3_9BACT|nr:MAG: addiction module toxin, HicA family [Candidatus Kaiserbacteria bacterium CG10_big_fil_rev_8_21_14_0_10_51_14]
MKRSKLIKYLESQGCFFVREGARHSLYGTKERATTVPRHSEIPDILAQKICRDLGIPKIRHDK